MADQVADGRGAGRDVTVTRSETADALEQQPDELDRLKNRLRRLYIVLTALVLILLFGAVAVGVSAWSRSSTPAQNSPDVGFARDMYTHHGQAVSMSMMMRNTVAEPFNSLVEDIVTGQAEQQGVMLGWLQDHDVLAADDSWEPMAWMAGTSGMADMSAHGMAPVLPSASASSAGATTGSTAGSTGPAATPAPAPSSMVGWGVMPGMATDAELTRLAELKGTEREVLYLRLMLRHHRAGADMARTYLRLGGDPQLRDLAQSVVTGQEREISIMSDLLAQRGATETAQ